jgi:hypothetical protein
MMDIPGPGQDIWRSDVWTEIMTSTEFGEGFKELRLSVYASAKVLGISLRQAQRYAASAD